MHFDAVFALLAQAVKEDKKIVKILVISHRLHTDLASIFKNEDDKSARFLHLTQIMIQLSQEEKASKYFIDKEIHEIVFAIVKRFFFRYKKEKKLIPEKGSDGKKENVSTLYKQFAS